MTEFSKILEQLRLRQGMSQKELAGALNVTPSVVSQYESGRTMPGYDVMLGIADCFQVSVDFLLGRNPDALETEKWLSADFCGEMSNRAFLTRCNALSKQQRSLLSGILLLLEREKRKR